LLMKFIYFDVGGVLIKDFSKSNKWVELLKKMGIAKRKWLELGREYDKVEMEFCTGRVSDEYIERLKNKYEAKLSDEFSLLKIMVEMFERNEGIWKIAKEASKKYKVGLLTNMYPGMLEMIKERDLLPPVDWDIEVDSSLVGLAKPQKEIYELAEKRAGVKGEEILFIDNTEKNLKEAKARGWKTFHFNSGDYEESNRELRAILG